MEDYLKNIYLIEKESKVARVSEISRRLSVKKASVVAAVRLLKKSNLLSHERYGFISLTESGKTEAEKLIKRNAVIKNFLLNTLKIPLERAEAEACAAEHVFSDDTTSKLAVMGAAAPEKKAPRVKKAKKRKK